MSAAKYNNSAILVCCLYWLLSSLAAAAQPVDAEQRQQQLDELRARIEGLTAAIEKTRGDQSSVMAQLQQSEQKIGSLAKRLRQLDDRAHRQQARIEQLKTDERQQSEALQAQRSLLEKQVLAAYAMGRQEQLKIWLNQQDPALVSRVLTYYDYLNQERLGHMRQLRQSLDQLQQIRNQLDREQQQLRQVMEQQQQEKRSIEQEQQIRRGVLAKLDLELSDSDRELSRLRADEQQLKTLIEGLDQALTDIPGKQIQRKPFPQLRGSLQWPAQGVLQHRFGEPKIGALRWDGVIIASNEGSEVRAIYAGRVAFADWLRGFGLLLIVDHGEGYMTLYGHNQSLFKEAGEWVEAGEPVAMVGSTGGRKDSGVYFAIRHRGKAINPVRWCRRADGRKVG